MRFNCEIYLIGVKYSENEKGDPIEKPTKRQMLAERKSIRQSEFYQAQASGLRPELTFTIWAEEYHGEPKLEYDGKEYTIFRTYRKDEKEMELICSGVVNNGSA